MFSPYYFFVSPSVIKSEATPNTEMILVADADLSPLNERHSFGSVHNLRDRRKDVYGLKLLAEDVKTETIMPD